MNACTLVSVILLCIAILWAFNYINTRNNMGAGAATATQMNNQTGGAFPPFSYLYQDISDGNPASWSNQDNPFVYKDKFIDEKSAQFVYQGSPNPLLHQMKPMKPAATNMFFFSNYDAKPECCPSPFSTSTGCVCIGAKPITTPQYEAVTDLPILLP